MKPVTYDFDVVTDAPAPKSHPPQATEKAPQPEPEVERSSGQRFAPPEHDLRSKVQAAE